MIKEEWEDVMTGNTFKQVKNSKELSRWAPGFMSMMARALKEQVFNTHVVKQKELTWSEHIAFGHVPYRRDCRELYNNVHLIEK